MIDPNTQIDTRLAILLEYLEEHDESAKDLEADPNYEIPDIDIGGVSYD